MSAHEDPGAGHNSRIQPRLVFIIGALSAFGPLSMTMYLPGLPLMAQELGASASEGQLTLTACLLGLAGGQIIAGPLGDAIGRRRPLLVGLVAYTLASLLCALAPSVSVLITLRFVQGVAGAAGVVTALATIRDLYSGAEVARFLTRTMLVTGLAPIFAPLIGAQILGFTSWRGVFLVLAIIGAVLVPVGVLGLRETLPAERRTTGEFRDTLATFRQLLTDRRFLGSALTSGFVGAALFSYLSGSPFVLQNIYGLSAQVFSLVIGCNALGFIITAQIGGRLVGRIPPQRLVAAGLSTSLLGALLFLVAVLANVGLVGILPALFLLIASNGLIIPNITALALADHPGMAGSAAALLGLMSPTMGAIISPLVGIAGSGTALPMAILLPSLIALAGGAFAFHRVKLTGLIPALPLRKSTSASRQRAASYATVPGATGVGPGVARGMRAITIAREYGSGGGEIAARLAHKLGWRLIDHEIVAQVAQQLGVTEEAAEAHDERTDDDLPGLAARVLGIQTSPVVPGPRDFTAEYPVFDEARRRVIQQALAAGQVVIVGRGSQLLLADRRDVLHAGIVAPLRERIAYVMQREGLDPAAAHERIRSKELELRRFLLAGHGQDLRDAYLYDIEVNTAVLDLDSAVDLLVLALERKAARLTTPREELGPAAGLPRYPAPPGNFSLPTVKETPV